MALGVGTVVWAGMGFMRHCGAIQGESPEIRIPAVFGPFFLPFQQISFRNGISTQK
jgi:hypothetical protein